MITVYNNTGEVLMLSSTKIGHPDDPLNFHLTAMNINELITLTVTDGNFAGTSLILTGINL